MGGALLGYFRVNHRLFHLRLREKTTEWHPAHAGTGGDDSYRCHGLSKERVLGFGFFHRRCLCSFADLYFLENGHCICDRRVLFHACRILGHDSSHTGKFANRRSGKQARPGESFERFLFFRFGHGPGGGQSRSFGPGVLVLGVWRKPGHGPVH